MKIGFIGLGSLGTPIASNLIQTQHEVFVYNRTASKTTSLAEQGAVVCNSIASLAGQTAVVFSIVSDDAALKEICEGDQGLIRNLPAGGIHVSMSTILPQTAAELGREHSLQQQHYLAAPVFGRPEAAQSRKINFVISGEEKTRKEIEPLLRDAGGAGVWDFGEEVTAANTVKLCGNFLIASALEAIGESAALAKASGVDAYKMWDMLTQTLFNAPVYQNYSKIVLNQQFEPAAFTAKLGLKDLNLVLAQANAAGQQMPLARLLQSNMQQLVEKGGGQLDWSAISTAVDKNLL